MNLFHRHRWGEWQKITIAYFGHEIEGPVARQERRCTTCGKYVRRRIR